MARGTGSNLKLGALLNRAIQLIAQGLRDSQGNGLAALAIVEFGDSGIDSFKLLGCYLDTR